MTGYVRTALGGALALGLAAGSAALSRVPYREDPGARAALRISWRARGERIQTCRHLTPQELEALPPHMRQEEVCEGGAAPYRLRVMVDDSLRVNAIVRGAGARHDRPLYVYQELWLEPGVHRIRVEFAMSGAARTSRPDTTEAGDSTVERAKGESDIDSGDERHVMGAARQIQRASAEEIVPRRLTLTDTITLAPRTLALVTYLPERRQLVLLSGDGIQDSGGRTQGP